jgi:hypothetical protein
LDPQTLNPELGDGIFDWKPETSTKSDRLALDLENALLGKRRTASRRWRFEPGVARAG